MFNSPNGSVRLSMPWASAATAASAADQVLGDIAHARHVAARLVELDDGELGVVLLVEPLVAEVAVDLVDPGHAAHQQPLEIELGRDPQ
jgi:hypothetical protein